MSRSKDILRSDAVVIACVLGALVFCMAMTAGYAWLFGKIVAENSWFFEQQLSLVSNAIEVVERWCGL